MDVESSFYIQPSLGGSMSSLLHCKYLALLLFCFSARAIPFTTLKTVQGQAQESLRRIEINIDEPGITKGAVIASPSKDAPNYFYHWVRDAALTMETFVQLRSTNAPAADFRMQNWVLFETHLQNLSSHLGEPKYNVDGSVFTGPWGRPQNDGPALRARTMILWAYQLLNDRQNDQVHFLTKIGGPIRRDLDYTMSHWPDPSFDVWEEVKGDHFFTRLSQAKALIIGANLYKRLGEKHYSQKLSKASVEVIKSLQSFWSDKEQVILPTMNHVEGLSGKSSNLDAAVLLASLYLTKDSEEFSVTDDRVISSIKKWRDSFGFYNINKGLSVWMLGRYPEDVYDGVGFGGGNPWFITTNAYIQAQCRIHHEWAKTKSIHVNSLNIHFIQDYLQSPNAVHEGDILSSMDSRFKMIQNNLNKMITKYFQKVLLHISRDGAISEQLSRHNGYMTGAFDLTWSHVSLIRAYLECGPHYAAVSQ